MHRGDKWVKTTNIQSQCTNKTLNTFSHTASMFVIRPTQKYSSLTEKNWNPSLPIRRHVKRSLWMWPGKVSWVLVTSICRLFFCSLQNNNKSVIIYTPCKKFTYVNTLKYMHPAQVCIPVGYVLSGAVTAIKYMVKWRGGSLSGRGLWPPIPWTEKRRWKHYIHYIPETSFARSNKSLKWTCIILHSFIGISLK